MRLPCKCRRVKTWDIVFDLYYTSVLDLPYLHFIYTMASTSPLYGARWSRQWPLYKPLAPSK